MRLVLGNLLVGGASGGWSGGLRGGLVPLEVWVLPQELFLQILRQSLVALLRLIRNISPPLSEDFGDLSVLEVWILLPNLPAVLLAEEQESIHRPPGRVLPGSLILRSHPRRTSTGACAGAVLLLLALVLLVCVVLISVLLAAVRFPRFVAVLISCLWTCEGVVGLGGGDVVVSLCLAVAGFTTPSCTASSCVTTVRIFRVSILFSSSSTV